MVSAVRGSSRLSVAERLATRTDAESLGDFRYVGAMANYVITGASSGIGRAAAVELATQPDGSPNNLLVHCRGNLSGLGETAQRIGDAGGHVQTISSDLGEDTAAGMLVKIAFDRLRRIDGWVHCAGADVLTGSLAEATFDEKFDRLWAVDVRAAAQVVRQLGPRLVEQSVESSAESSAERPPVSIVLIGWDQSTPGTDGAGMEGEAGMLFGPVKAAVTSLGLAAAQTYAPTVRVNVVAPGWIRTAWGEQTEGYWDARARGQALVGRWGTPGDVAAAIGFLIRPTSGFVTGQVINVNGGFNRRVSR